MADSSCQFNSIIFLFRAKPRLCRQAMSPSPRRCTAPNREYPSRRRFQKAVRYFPQACRSRRQSRCRKRRVHEQHIIDYGSTSLKSYSLEFRSHFSPAPAKCTKKYTLHASKSKALFLKRPGILSKVFIILISSVPTILSNYFLPALTYVFRRCTPKPMAGKSFCAAVLSLPSTARSCGAGIFFCSIPARRSTFPRDAPPTILGTDIDLGYLGHIFVVAERFFQLNADEAGDEPSSVAVRNDDNLF